MDIIQQAVASFQLPVSEVKCWLAEFVEDKRKRWAQL